MTTINNITKLEIEIEKNRGIKNELDKGTGSTMKLIGEVLEPIIKALENARSAILDEHIIRSEVGRKADLSLENWKKMNDWANRKENKENINENDK